MRANGSHFIYLQPISFWWGEEVHIELAIVQTYRLPSEQWANNAPPIAEVSPPRIPKIYHINGDNPVKLGNDMGAFGIDQQSSHTIAALVKKRPWNNTATSKQALRVRVAKPFSICCGR